MATRSQCDIQTRISGLHRTRETWPGRDCRSCEGWKGLTPQAHRRNPSPETKPKTRRSQCKGRNLLSSSTSPRPAGDNASPGATGRAPMLVPPQHTMLLAMTGGAPPPWRCAPCTHPSLGPAASSCRHPGLGSPGTFRLGRAAPEGPKQGRGHLGAGTRAGGGAVI